MAGPTIQVTLAGDATSLDRALDRAGRAAIDAGKDFDRAGGEAKKFGKSMDGMSSSVDASEGKFMGAADLLDGLGGAFGLPTEGVTNLARSFGDLAGGVTSVVIPAIQSMWAVLAANPVFLVIAAIVAIGAALAIAYFKVKGFRDFVDNAFDSIAGFGRDVWDGLVSGLKAAGNIVLRSLETIANAAIFALTAPIQLANKIPGVKNFVPDIPKVRLPRLAKGGITTGPTMALLGDNPGGREMVTPLPPGAGPADMGTTIQITVMGNVLDGRQLGDLVHSALLDKQRRAGRLGLA